MSDYKSIRRSAYAEFNAMFGQYTGPSDGPSMDTIREQQQEEQFCECGGEFDEDDRCDSCSNGHDDCEAQECFACFERANDRAELWADMARDEEMGL